MNHVDRSLKASWMNRILVFERSVRVLLSDSLIRNAQRPLRYLKRMDCLFSVSNVAQLSLKQEGLLKSQGGFESVPKAKRQQGLDSGRHECGDDADVKGSLRQVLDA